MFGTTNKDAAILLMNVRKIAIDEVRSCDSPQSTSDHAPLASPRTTPSVPPKTTWALGYSPNLIKHLSYNVIEASPLPRMIRTISTSRFRTVSVCSSSEVDEIRGPYASSASDVILLPREHTMKSESAHGKKGKMMLMEKMGSNGSEEHFSDSSVSSTLSGQEVKAMLDVVLTDESVRRRTVVQDSASTKASLGITSSGSSNKLVGTRVDGTTEPVKDVLRKKFSWKSFPELEQYLIDNRAEYLQFSNQLNYTAEQKRYNNKLTQGLLDLAAEEGYLFEGFTFAAVRDRIRCYYKSYVQATKKKKLKTKRPSAK